jgi:flagellar motor component MotA
MLRVEEYTEKICAGLNLPGEDLALIQEEIQGHVEEIVKDKTVQGLSEEAALSEAINEMGDPRELQAGYRDTYYKQHLSRWLGRIAGIGLLFLLIGVAALQGGGFAAYRDFHALLLVPVGATLLLLGTYRTGTICRAIVSPFRLTVDGNRPCWSMVRSVLRTWAVYMLGCGLLAVTLGSLLICLSAENPWTLGPALALALLGLTYGALLSGLLWAITQSLPGDRAVQPGSGRNPWLAALCIGTFLVILLFIWTRYAPLSQLVCLALNIPSILFVAGGTLGLTLASFGINGTLSLVRLRFHKMAANEKRPESLRTVGIYFGMVGIIGVLVGAVFMLSTLDDTAGLMPGIALCLVTLLYGVVLGLTCWVLAGSVSPRPDKK